MKKMTRFLALVTVLVLMLSMSVTAFAASPHSTATGTCKEVKYQAGFFDCIHDDDSSYHLQKDDVIKAGASFNKPTAPGKKIILDGYEVKGSVRYPYHEVRITDITNDTLSGGGIWDVNPQPKTGVMDTLPLWFGVMAVSACAYVLTSKKKVF